MQKNPSSKDEKMSLEMQSKGPKLSPSPCHNCHFQWVIFYYIYLLMQTFWALFSNSISDNNSLKHM
jgi:hypothetical protein